MTEKIDAIGVRWGFQGVTYNALLAVATPEEADRVRALRFVQFVEPYYPYYRFGSRKMLDLWGIYELRVVPAPPWEPALIEYMRGLADPNSLFRVDGSGIWLTTTGRNYELIRRHPLVIFV